MKGGQKKDRVGDTGHIGRCLCTIGGKIANLANGFHHLEIIVRMMPRRVSVSTGQCTRLVGATRVVSPSLLCSRAPNQACLSREAVLKSWNDHMSLLLEKVRKSYVEPSGRKLPVLGIDRFEVKQGEQVALLGASGGGKTTLLNIISGILTPDTGSVVVDGRDLATMPEVVRDRYRANRIGIVFQTFNLLPAFTALENVMLGMAFSGKGADRDFAKQLLERVGLGHRLNHSPAKLSVGEQQRVAVARALANKPVLLLADEPTANVDPANQQLILDLIRDTCRDHNVSLLMVTHSMDVASSFKRVERLQDFNHPELCL